MSSIFPFVGNVMRKNLAVCGSDRFALAKPLNGDAIFIVMALRVWLCDDPAEADPIKQSVVSCPMQNTVALYFAAIHSPTLLNAYPKKARESPVFPAQIKSTAIYR